MSLSSLNTKLKMRNCRVCLSSDKSLCPLFKYKLSGNYAEMLTAIANVKLSASDGLPDKICTKCRISLEKAYLLKTLAERSDRRLRKMLSQLEQKTPLKKISFDSFTDVKSEIAPLNVKPEPNWEMEIEVLPNDTKAVETIDGKDIVIANTVIRKVDPNAEQSTENEDIKPDLTWEAPKTRTSTPTSPNYDAEYIEDDIFQDDDDDDYVPPAETKKIKFKKPKLDDIKVFKEKKGVVRKVKVIRKRDLNDAILKDGLSKSTTITCYPILKNGSRGAPILLKRPKDSTILKVHSNYKSRSSSSLESAKGSKSKPVRMVQTERGQMKEREKLVCPVCGILTYTLGNHIATHQEKKKFTCSQCTKTFTQKSNLLCHMKQHSGVKDHICEICGAGFYSQKSLVRHNLIHKGERPFPCNLCTKRFIARCDLNRHLRIHSGYKPFKCGTCSMSFNAKHQLQNHERMHTGERPYTCEPCNVAFSYKVNLNNHVFKNHGINLKFKSIHNVTEEILRRELEIASDTRLAISQILPQLTDVPTPGAHETVPHHSSDYSV